MQWRAEKLLLLGEKQECSPHTNIPISHLSCQLLSLVTAAGGAGLGGQEELHSGGGSNVKIAFFVYFNFTECWVNRAKAPDCSSFLFTSAVLTQSNWGKAQGVVFTHLQWSWHLGGKTHVAQPINSFLLAFMFCYSCKKSYLTSDIVVHRLFDALIKPLIKLFKRIKPFYLFQCMQIRMLPCLIIT